MRKALKIGLQLAKDLLIQDFVLEGDSLILANAMKELSSPPSAIAALVYSSLAALHEFRHGQISHVCRQGSNYAHLLAKHALVIADFSI